jgi:hypothetical protein
MGGGGERDLPGEEHEGEEPIVATEVNAELTLLIRFFSSKTHVAHVTCHET